MSDLMDAGEQAILDHMFNLSSWTAPTSIVFKAWTTAPNEDGTGGVECSGGSYASKSVNTGSGEWTRTASQVVNDNDIAFVKATGSWGTVVCITAEDHSGNYLWRKTGLSTAITTDDILTLEAGDVTVDMA